MRIESMGRLFREMRAVARGEIPAPADAAMPSAESVEIVAELIVEVDPQSAVRS